MDKLTFIESRPYLKKAADAIKKAENALGGGSRWGETRRFAGRSAGLRLERLDRARKRWSQAWDKAETEYFKVLQQQ